MCLSVYLSVCQRHKSRTVGDIVTKLSGHHPMVERANKFENGAGSDLMSQIVRFQFQFEFQ